MSLTNWTISNLLREIQIEAFFRSLPDFTYNIANGHLVLQQMVTLSTDDSIWSQWQFLLKLTATMNQGGRCICGHKLYNSQLHHALISRQEVQGQKVHEQVKIHNSLNVLELHDGCHRNITKEQSYQFLLKLYGPAVNTWYEDNKGLNSFMFVPPKIGIKYENIIL